MTLIGLENVGQHLSHLFHNSYFAPYAAINQSKNKPACRLCIFRLVFNHKNTILSYLLYPSSLPLFYDFSSTLLYFLSISNSCTSFLHSFTPCLYFSFFAFFPPLFLPLFNLFFLSFTPVDLTPRYYLLQAGLLSSYLR